MIVHQHLLGPMANFIYFLLDPQTSKIAVVDPAWDVPFICHQIKENGWELDKILLTHGHNDHTNGLDELLSSYGVPVYLSSYELPMYTPTVSLERFNDADSISIGSESVTVIHTPGHTPGSVCFKTEHHLIAGDMLFIDGCGRVDLPGGNPEDMYASLRKLHALEDSLTVWPGHDYGDKPSALLGELKKSNPYLSAVDKSDFMSRRGV